MLITRRAVGTRFAAFDNVPRRSQRRQQKQKQRESSAGTKGVGAKEIETEEGEAAVYG